VQNDAEFSFLGDVLTTKDNKFISSLGAPFYQQFKKPVRKLQSLKPLSDCNNVEKPVPFALCGLVKEARQVEFEVVSVSKRKGTGTCQQFCSDTRAFILGALLVAFVNVVKVVVFGNHHELLRGGHF